MTYITHVTHITYTAHTIHITHILKFIFEAYKILFFYIYFFLYIKINKYYRKHKERLQKEARGRYQNLSEEEKEKRYQY